MLEKGLAFKLLRYPSQFVNFGRVSPRKETVLLVVSWLLVILICKSGKLVEELVNLVLSHKSLNLDIGSIDLPLRVR